MVSVWKKSKVGVAGIAGRTGRPENTKFVIWSGLGNGDVLTKTYILNIL